MADKVRVAIIGCGAAAEKHCKGLGLLWDAGYRQFEVVAACDIVRESAERVADDLAKTQGTRPVVRERFDSLMNDGPEFDAAEICVVPRDHHTVAISCFEAGKHVTVEKPLAVTLRAGRMMLCAAQKAGRILHVAENRRLREHYRAVRWAIDEGMIGEPRMIYWIEAAERLWYWGWREHKLQAGAGWTLDCGVHYCDLFRYFMGPAKSVSAATKAFFPFRYKDEKNRAGKVSVDVEDTAMATIEFESGALGLWVTTTAAPGEAFARHIIYGDKGSISWETGIKSAEREMTMEQIIATHQASISDEERERLFPLGIKMAAAIEMRQFLEAIQGRGRVETDGLEGYRAEAMSLAVFESDALGRKVALSEVESLEVETYQSEVNRALGIKS